MARAITRFRQTLGDTQQQFAARAGLSVTSVARYETNSRPSSAVVCRFAEIARKADLLSFIEIFERRLPAAQEIDLQNFSAIKQLLERKVATMHPSQLSAGKLALACLLCPPNALPKIEHQLGDLISNAEEVVDQAATELVRRRDPEVERKRLKFLRTREIEDWIDFSDSYEALRAGREAQSQSKASSDELLLDRFSVQAKTEDGVPLELTESTVFIEEWEDDAESNASSEDRTNDEHETDDLLKTSAKPARNSRATKR